MRTGVLWIAGVLAAAMPAAAQYVTHPQTGFGVTGGMSVGKSETVMTASPDRSAACPVNMRAERRSGLAVMQARGAGKQGNTGEKPAAGQRLYLEIERGELGVVEARVTVHGTRAWGRVYPIVSGTALAGPGAKESAEAIRSFTLRPGDGDAAKIASDLILQGFTSIQSISLDAVTYADGSTWGSGGGRFCSVEPDPLMLVGRK